MSELKATFDMLKTIIDENQGTEGGFAGSLTTMIDGIREALGLLSGLGSGDEETGFVQAMTDIRTAWMSVFGPITQEDTLMWYMFSRDDRSFFQQFNKRIALEFHVMKYNVWGGEMFKLGEFLGLQIRDLIAIVKVAFYDFGKAMAEAIAQGIIDNAGVIGQAVQQAVNTALGNETAGGNKVGGGYWQNFDPFDTDGGGFLYETRNSVKQDNAGAGAGGDHSTNNTTNVYINGVNIGNAPDAVKEFFVDMATRKHVHNRGPSNL
jgi:hypothetical protein